MEEISAFTPNNRSKAVFGTHENLVLEVDEVIRDFGNIRVVMVFTLEK
jgi:hypothetical protein